MFRSLVLRIAIFKQISVDSVDNLIKIGIVCVQIRVVPCGDELCVLVSSSVGEINLEPLTRW